ncbi:MAG: hypothetical protein ABJF50_20630 [Paracoccaceae bacterium]
MSEPSDLWDGLWMRLGDGLSRADAPARSLALATQRIGGGGAVRMVILRGVEQAVQSLTFYTHAASDKVAELGAVPEAEVLLWDAATSFQARLAVEVTATAGSLDLWNSFSDGARLNYVPTLTPGAKIAAPHVPDPAGPEAFTVLTAKIISADILDLSALPHRRANFDTKDDFTGQWVAP